MIALSLFPSPMQVALHQAASAIMSVDVGVPCPIHRPGGLRGIFQDDFVDHLHAPGDRPDRWQLVRSAKFPVFPGFPRTGQARTFSKLLRGPAHVPHDGAAAAGFGQSAWRREVGTPLDLKPADQRRAPGSLSSARQAWLP